MSIARAIALAFTLVACSNATEPAPGTEPYRPLDDSLKGCNGEASTFVPADGDFVLTTFGATSDSQPFACGGSSQSGSWYYAASEQRFGCGAHIQISANGNCVVAQAADYGPDVCVEKAAGGPVLDASPLVAKVLFGQSSFGWSDQRHVTVELVGDSTPLGPCAVNDVPDGGAQACSADWQCNPGADGSGLICVNSACVPGCHEDWQCPGSMTCLGGQCG